MVRVEMQAAARNDLDGFADDHAVQIDEIARSEIGDGDLVLGWDVVNDSAGPVAKVDDGTATQRFERDENVIARIELQYGVGHVFVNGDRFRNGLSLARIQCARQEGRGLAAEL